MARLLARRGITDSSAAEAFFNPTLEQLHDPGQLCNLEAAVERLVAARQAGESVALVGDYDVDGVSGAAILVAVLQACGIEVHPILPHRMVDGYGFQPSHVEQAKDLGARIVLTVDCGTNSLAAAEAAIAAGIDVLVTDHHLPDEPLPPEVLLVNPHQPACSYPFTELSGAGLALKVALAVAAACERDLDPRILLRVACLGTIADLVPLRGENRVIAAVGLQELARTRSPGLKALIDVAGVQPPFSASDIGFRIGPRLNAPGRLDSAQKALDLILCRDPQDARQLAGDLDRWNRERQEAERRVVEQAREAFTQRPDEPAILVAWSVEWHRGVVGVAAGRLARELHRPVILLGVSEDSATGSGRSAADIHLHDFLAEWRDEMPRFGGHAQAIGLTVETAKLEDLRQRWEEAAEVWRERIATRHYDYELELECRDLRGPMVRDLLRFEPHGQG
ncbi:MAG: single-stranded-DNA-specific exonuclease RecJ, partial [Acidobacteriota bacterium]